MLMSLSAQTDELVQTFKSPSFSGIGLSAHYLTIDSQEVARKEAIAEKIESDLRALEREADNTTIARFLRNLESRIFAQISKQLVDNMFDEDNMENAFGSFVLEGNIVSYVKTTCSEGMESCVAGEDIIVLTIVDSEGSETIITLPLGTGGF